MKNIAKLLSIFSLCILLSAERKANAQISFTYNYSNSVQTWTVPCGTNAATVNLWSAGGGSGNWNYYSGLENGGGSGSFYSGVLTGLNPGDIISLYVPEGGQSIYYSEPGGAGGWPGGGTGGDDYYYGEDGGGGGGYAAIQINGTYYVVVGAGAGGGSAPFTDAHGGEGGATTGGDGGTGYGISGAGGGGATISTGGAGGTGGQPCDPDSAGVYLRGGYGGGTTCSGQYGGGGGGGGYYGGGGASDEGGGGGGGSSFPAAPVTFGGITFTPISNLQGTPGGYYDVYPPGSPLNYGVGVGGGSNDNGGGGEIDIYPNSVPIVTSDSGIVINGVSCNGGSNASVYAYVVGSGPSNTTYMWAPGGQTTDTVTGLSSGTYTVSIVGYCGSASASVTITQPNILTVTGNVVSNVTCHGSGNGVASAIVNGGTLPYSYTWSNANSNDSAAGLSAGIYRVIVIDNNGCSGSTSVTITEPNVLTSLTNVTSNATCGISNGSVTSAVGGGTTPYTYAWTGGATTASISGLAGATYYLTVTDNNGCVTNSSSIVTETPAVYASAGILSNVACSGGNDGSVIANISGGTAPFNYLWNNGSTDFSVAGLTMGSYTVTITDVNGCSSSAQTSITQPSAINVVVDTTVDIGGCTGSAWVVVSGGVAPYVYAWSNGNTTFEIAGECKGTYCCNITDANGCIKEVCATITSITGVDNVQSTSAQITVYPNPNNGEFNIESSVDNGKSIIEVYNVLGEKVYATSLTSTKGVNTVNMGSQPNGIYLYRLMTESGTLLGEGKLILQK